MHLPFMLVVYMLLRKCEEELFEKYSIFGYSVEIWNCV